MFMFHNYSGGAFGKGGEMIDQLIHERKWSERLLNEIYKDFLTEDEIKSILDNKDIWMDGEEVVKRIEDKMKKLQAEQEAAQAVIDEYVEKKVKQKKTVKKDVQQS